MEKDNGVKRSFLSWVFITIEALIGSLLVTVIVTVLWVAVVVVVLSLWKGECDVSIMDEYSNYIIIPYYVLIFSSLFCFFRYLDKKYDLL